MNYINIFIALFLINFLAYWSYRFVYDIFFGETDRQIKELIRQQKELNKLNK